MCVCVRVMFGAARKANGRRDLLCGCSLSKILNAFLCDVPLLMFVRFFSLSRLSSLFTCSSPKCLSLKWCFLCVNRRVSAAKKEAEAHARVVPRCYRGCNELRFRDNRIGGWRERSQPVIAKGGGG